MKWNPFARHKTRESLLEDRQSKETLIAITVMFNCWKTSKRTSSLTITWLIWSTLNIEGEQRRRRNHPKWSRAPPIIQSGASSISSILDSFTSDFWPVSWPNVAGGADPIRISQWWNWWQQCRNEVAVAHWMKVVYCFDNVDKLRLNYCWWR